ncbi:MAG: hypothetical protein JXR71_04930 [Bacteroidales bacterium]|nr:hypothetical protein [Bacteroidales bacterium]
MRVTRDYHLSDAVFLEHSEVIAATLPADLPAFTAFDATFTADYVTGFQQAIDESKAILPDAVLIDEMAAYTHKVEKAMDACYEDYKTLAYFVRKAFKDSPAVRNQFGLNDIKKARMSQPKMIVFMESLAKTALKYSEELLAVGCPQSLIDGLPAQATALHDANIAQEQYKDERALQTQLRIQLLNKVYALLRPLYEAAKFVFADDPQRLSVYTLPKPAKATEDDPEAAETPEAV